MQSATPVEHHRFHFLDALRGVAALLVILRHAPTTFSHGLVSRTSWLAVDFFFCLSGFVIAFSYERRLRTHLTLSSFLVARIIRLYPLAALGTVIGLVTVLLNRFVHASSVPLHIPCLLSQFVLGVLILPRLSFHDKRAVIFPLDGVMYTLLFELLANLLYAALTRVRAATNLVVLLTFLVSVVLLITERLVFHSFDLGFSTGSMPVGLLRVSLSFSAGVLVFRWFQHSPRTQTALLAALAIFALFVAALSDAFAIFGPAASELFTVILLFPALVLAGSFVVLPSRWTALCAFLGTISYPLYILHFPMLWPLSLDGSIAYAIAHPSAANLILVSYALLLVLISWSAANVYDAPLRRVLTRSWQARSARKCLTTGPENNV